MNTFIFKQSSAPKTIGKALKILALLLMLWLVAPLVIHFFQPLAGQVDAGIWQLIVLALICWILILSFSAILAQYISQKLTLLVAQAIPSPLNLTSWQQLVLFWASFALLVLSATGCLMAIC